MWANWDLNLRPLDLQSDALCDMEPVMLQPVRMRKFQRMDLVFVARIWKVIQSNFDGSNIFGTIENCSRHGWFEPLRVNYGAKSGNKWR